VVVELAEEIVFIPGQEQIGDEGGCGDTHGNADALADEVASEGDVCGGDEEAENFQELGDGEDAGGGVGGRGAALCSPLASQAGLAEPMYAKHGV
jgi:hypothetical protein